MNSLVFILFLPLLFSFKKEEREFVCCQRTLCEGVGEGREREVGSFELLFGERERERERE